MFINYLNFIFMYYTLVYRFHINFWTPVLNILADSYFGDEQKKVTYINV